MEHNLTSMNTSSSWYFDDPFILAIQAQQMFDLNDMKRGAPWKVAQKVNHREIFDILEASDEADGLLNNKVFQEKESIELPPFQSVEEVIESSTLFRGDVQPLIIAGELVVELNINQHDLMSDDDDDNDDEAEYDENDNHDDDNIFYNNEDVYSDGEEDVDPDDEDDVDFDDDGAL